MATKEDIEKVALVIADSLEEGLEYVPSPALCRDFAMRVLVEAKSVNKPLNPSEWIMGGFTETLEEKHSGQE